MSEAPELSEAQALAAELLPTLEAEAEQRRQARLERAKAKRAATRKPKTAAAA